MNGLNEKIPLFTIGIASYNYARYITRLLDSIKRQSYMNYEVLISDDCSTDNSLQVIKSYMHKNPSMNIRLLESAVNEGLVRNKNKLIEHSLGEYLMLCDADDWLDDDCLHKMAEILEKEHPDRLISEVAHVNTKGEIIQVQELSPTQSKWCWNIHHGSVYRKDILIDNNIRIADGLIDDVYLTVEFAKYCNKVSMIQEVLYFWFVHVDSEGRKQNPDVNYHINQTSNVLDFIKDTIRYIENRADDNGGNDLEELRLLTLKIYYFNIFFPTQKAALKDKIKVYRQLQFKIADLDPFYLRNKCLGNNKKPVLRSYTFKVIRLCVFLEKRNLLLLLILASHIMSKIIYFDQ